MKSPEALARQRLDRGTALARFALIGVVLAAVAGTFGYFGGWFTPNDLTPARLTDGFEHVDGVHSGFRRNHAKGVDVSGFFESNGKGVRLSKATVFQPGRVPVIGRFSLGGWPTRCGRHAGAGTRPGTTVFPCRRRNVADGDDQPARISGQDP